MNSRTIPNTKNMFDKRKTITLDLDDTHIGYVLFRCEQLNRMGANEIRYRKSASGNGFHVKAFMEEPVDSLLTRFYLGDDPERLYLDAGHVAHGSAETTNVLATRKSDGTEAGSWKRYK